MINKKFLLSLAFSWLSLFYAIYLYAQGSWNILHQKRLEVYHDVEFVDQNNGWVVGYVSVAAIEEENRCDLILHTMDGGKTWEYQKYKTGKPTYIVDFVDSLTGWVLADGDIVLKTNNGGRSWIQETWYSSFFFFIDPQKGWRTSNDGKNLFYTENGGNTWSLQYTADTDDRFYLFFFVDSLFGWAVGQKGILHTIDGGSNWKLQFRSTSSLGLCTFLDRSTGWVLGRDIQNTEFVLKTCNGGQDWTKHSFGSSMNLYNISFVDSLQGWIVGDRWYGIATIWHTQDGGENWISQESGLGEMSSLYSVCFTDSGNGWAVGRADGELCLGTVIKYSLDPMYIPQAASRSDGMLQAITLFPNYPNPCNQGTTFRYLLSQPSRITLVIYNLRGQLITTLLQNQIVAEGEHEIHWNGRNANQEIIPSGIYYLVLKSDIGTLTRKILILK